MTIDAFKQHEKVLDDYRDYVHRVLNIRDPGIKRAGTDMILIYRAKEATQWLNE
jgi:delta-aminolevulinic acid dehydratase/porphobilinogen synthase